MSGGQRRRGPVGLGYMPKGGAKAAEQSNDRWRSERVLPVPEVPAALTTVDQSGAGARQRDGFRLAGVVRARVVLGAAAAAAGVSGAVAVGLWSR